MFVLFSASLITTFNGFSPFVSGTEPIQVGTEPELRSAINAANGPATIALTTDIALTDSALNFSADKDITLVSANNGERFWKLIGAANQYTISVSGKLTLEGIIVTHTSGAIGGGANVVNGGTLNMNSGAVANNTVADANGGGVLVSLGSFTMTGNSCVVNNSANNGGGVYIIGGSFSMVDSSRVAYNTATGNNWRDDGGGGVHNNGGNFSMSGSSIVDNNTAIFGGGVCLSNFYTNFTMTDNSVVANNTATRDGGGVYVNSIYTNFTMTDNSSVANNTAEYDGGGMYNRGPLRMLGDSSVANNTAQNGGGVYLWSLNAQLNMTDNSRIVNNTAISIHSIWDIPDVGLIVNKGGGGVYIQQSGKFSMFGSSSVVNNRAINGGVGGGVHNAASTFTMTDNSVVANNTATNGGGMYSFGGFELTRRGSVVNNTANNGGGVYLDGAGSIWMADNSIISGNTAINGGGVYILDSFINARAAIWSGTISDNVASDSGGGIWVAANDENFVVSLERLYIDVGVVFSNNRASAAYSRSSTHDEVYEAQIKCTSWTSPFVQGYNNYDIGYTASTPLAVYSVSVSGSYATASGAGSYLDGALVTVSAGTRAGYTFSGWTVNEGNISLANSATTTFSIPEHNIAITANWTPTSTGGSNNSGSGGGSSNNSNSGSSSSAPKPSPSAPVPSEPTPNIITPSPPLDDNEEAGSSFPITIWVLMLVTVGLVIVGVTVLSLRKQKI